MNQAYFRPRVIPNVVTLIVREVPGNGPILAKPNQEVTPSDVLGLSITSPGFRVVNLAKELGCSAKDCQKYLQKGIGQAVFRGEVLALKQQLLRQTPFISPADGIIDSYDPETGNLKLAFLPDRQKITSAVYGVVQSVDTKSRKVYIKTAVTEIMGVLGSGRVREGNILVLGNNSAVTTQSSITPKATDHIIVTGGLIYKEALRQAVAISVKGVITGGIAAADFKGMSGGSLVRKGAFATDVGLSLVVCEGFGVIPMGEDVYKTLVKYNDKFAVVDGSQSRILLPSPDRDSILKVRSIALPPEHQRLFDPVLMDLEAASPLKPGHLLRVVAPPFIGEQGKLLGIDKVVSKLPSGLSSYLLTIETKRRKIKVPINNVEII
jgi:hypothetical protein